MAQKILLLIFSLFPFFSLHIFFSFIHFLHFFYKQIIFSFFFSFLFRFQQIFFFFLMLLFYKVFPTFHFYISSCVIFLNFIQDIQACELKWTQQPFFSSFLSFIFLLPSPVLKFFVTLLFAKFKFHIIYQV